MAAADWQPAPTYESPVIFQADDPQAQELLARLRTTFSPNWLNWFLELAALLSAVGGGGGGIEHNLLSGLQGGTTDQYYHLNETQYNAINTSGGDHVANQVFGG